MPLKKTVSNIERAVEIMSENCDELLNRLENQEKETIGYSKTFGAIEMQCKIDADEKKMLQMELNLY